MSFGRKITPWLFLVTGLMWLVGALRSFGWLNFLNVDWLHDYRGSHPHESYALLWAANALLYLTGAALAFLENRRNPQGNAEPVVTTLFGQK